jgi:hypothetical protein
MMSVFLYLFFAFVLDIQFLLSGPFDSYELQLFEMGCCSLLWASLRSFFDKRLQLAKKPHFGLNFVS